MCVAVQDPGKKKFYSSLAGGVVDKKSQKKYLPGHTGEELLQIFTRRGQSRLAKMYNFLRKCTNSSPGVVGEKKSDFFTQEFLAMH